MKAVRCSKCDHSQPLELLATGRPFPCPRCQAELRVSVFPAIHRAIGPGAVAEPAVLDGETTCFFHADKKAAVVCDGCGRFLCTLCDVPLAGQHLCPKCVEAGREKNTLTTIETYRTSYPSLALTFAFLPLLVWPLTFLTAPLTIFLVFYGWGKPPSLTGRKRRVASIIALLFALGQCVGWAFLAFGFYTSMTYG